MAKLGSSAHPAVVRVQTPERAHEIFSVCDRQRWKAIVGVEPDKPEDLSDLEKLLNPPAPVISLRSRRREPALSGRSQDRVLTAPAPAAASR